MDRKALNRLRVRIWNILNYQRKRELNRKWREAHPDYWRQYIARKRLENPTWYKLYLMRNYRKRRVRIENRELSERELKLMILRQKLGQPKKMLGEWDYGTEESSETNKEVGE